MTIADRIADDARSVSPSGAAPVAASDDPFLVARSGGLRVAAIDWMRGLAMVLMATDHASGAFNAARPITDSALFYDPSQPLDPWAFGYRWVSHLCAPVFLFLAGTSLALSIGRKRRHGMSSWRVDRDLFVRGLIILAIDLTFIHYLWVQGVLLLQVMFAIGLSFLLMIPARRLPPLVLAVLAVLVLIAAEFARAERMYVEPEALELLRSLLFSGGWIELPDSWGHLFGETGSTNGILVAYPVLPWWSMMALGWVFGVYLVKSETQRRDGTPSARSPARVMFAFGAVSLVIYAILRGLNGFGNLGLLRLDHSWVQWLHVSKYPPSLTFTALELGLMGLILAGMFRWSTSRRHRASRWNPLLVFGQTAFFFYVAHILVLEVSAHLLGVYQQKGLTETVIACAVVLMVMYPACVWYRAFKSRHPQSVLRYF